ncbi:hypothetical protein ACFL3U_00515 [Pseudomonadota bacterium]
MNAPTTLVCWKCGSNLSDIADSIDRNDVCQKCQAEVHVCKMCEFYDPHVSDSCREPIAESVNNKERANFCGYFKPKPSAYQPTDSLAQSDALAHLNALFGESDKTESQDSTQEEDKLSDNERAQQKLNDLFSSD